jgi:hypothetical protein
MLAVVSGGPSSGEFKGCEEIAGPEAAATGIDASSNMQAAMPAEPIRNENMEKSSPWHL